MAYILLFLFSLIVFVAIGFIVVKFFIKLLWWFIGTIWGFAMLFGTLILLTLLWMLTKIVLTY